MNIESFFPGRIRVRSSLFREQAHVDRARALLAGHDGVVGVDANQRTGSLTILYDAGVITMDMLMEAKAEIERWEKS